MDENQPLPLYNPSAVSEPPPMSLAAVTETAPDTNVVDQRTTKYDFALGANSPGRDTIRNMLSVGAQGHLAESVAARKEAEDQNHRLGIIQAISKMREGPVSNEEFDVIRGIKPDPQGRNVSTILEQEYARQFMNYVTRSTYLATNLSDMAQKDGDTPFRMTDIASTVKAKDEVTLRVLQDYEKKYKDTGWPSIVGNYALNLIPGYSTWSTQRMLPNLEGSLWPGKGMAEKIQSLHLMNPTDYEATLVSEAKRLFETNPPEAMRFLRAVKQYTSSDAGIDNAFAFMDIAGLTPFGKARPAVTAAHDAAVAAGRFMTAEEIKTAQEGAAGIVSADRAARTVPNTGNRVLTPGELARADVFVPKGPSEFTPEQIAEMGLNLAKKPDLPVETPRMMTIHELSKARWPDTARNLTPEEIEVMGKRLEVANTYKAIIKASSDPEVSLPKVIAAAGDVSTSAVLQSAQEAAVILQGKEGIKSFGERVQSFLNPTRLDDATGISAEATKRIVNGLDGNTKLLLSAITDPVRVRRMPDLALIAGMKETEQRIKSLHPGVDDTILDIKWNLGRAPESVGNFPADKKLVIGNEANVNSVSFYLGRKDGTLFESKANAEWTGNMQYKLGKQAYEAEQVGGGWALRVDKAVDETTPGVRDLMIQTETQTPASMWNIFLGHLRSSQDVTSLLSSASRSLVTHGGQAMQAIIKEVAQNIGALSKDEMKNMKRFFAADRDFHGPDQIPGRFLDTAGQFEVEYNAMFSRLPTEKETLAYFSYRQLNDFDYLTRNLGFYRDLSRLGVENVRFKFKDEVGAGKYTDYFMARERKDLPTGPNSPGANVYIYDNATGVGKSYRTGGMSSETLADINQKLKADGYKVFEIANPIERPLGESLGRGDYINFVLVRDVNTRPIDHNLIPYKAGGHREYATNWFVKQADIADLGGRANYQGDKTLIGQYTQAETRRYADSLNKAREMLKAKDVGFDAFVARNLPAEWGAKELRQKFGSGAWNIDEPFHVTTSGQTVKDVDAAGLKARYGDKLHDEANSPYNLFQQVDKKFTGSRDPALKHIRETGTEINPQYVLEDAPLIDPLRSLNRTVSNVVHQRLISDYKWQAAETFVQEFGKYLDVPFDTLRQNPLYWMNNPKWASTPDAVGLSTAKAQRNAVLAFLGMDSPDVRAVKWLNAKALDTLYTKAGQGASDYVASHELSSVSDPFKYARNLVFHEKLGLFNPVSIINQLQTLTHVTALAGPVTAAKAMAGATLMTMLRFTENPATIAHFDGIATSFGWKPGQLTHAYDQMRRSGWHLVNNESSWKNDVSDPKMFQSAWGKFLDAGTVFFTEGERMTRTAAWAASYLENTAGKTVSKFDDQTLQRTLARADLMNVNMTRASQAPWQQGIPGVVTQFMPYQVRLFEQLWGGRLSTVEKARVLATYGAMYGVPATAGVAVGFWPMYDSIRTHALETNVYGDGKAWDNSLTRLLMEGLPSEMIRLATGKDTNYSERFSPPGLSGIHDLLTGDKKWWEIMTGVAGTAMTDTWKAMSPLVASVGYAVLGKSKDYPFVAEDVVDAARPITTFNNLYKAIYAANWGKYITKNEGVIADADKMDALLTGAFGLTRRDISDQFRLIKSNKQLKAAQDAIQTEIVREIRRAYQAAGSNDTEASSMHITRSQHLFQMGDFTPSQFRDIMKQGASGYENLGDRVRFDFFYKKAPASQQQQRMKALGVTEGQQ